jgi:flagellar basal-body rod modification protein FlgD
MINLSSLTGNGVGQTTGSAKAPGEIGQQDFLKLMVTQLRNQDPFSPMENGEFLAQIAQFTTATGVQEMQQSFNRFSQTIATEQALQAAGLVGREVLVESPVGNLPSDGSLTGSLQLPVRLDNCKVAIYSESGELVREIALGQQEAGEAPFSWDGKDGQGRQLPPGRYLIAASTQVEGEEIAIATYTSAQVQSVTLGTGGNPPTLSLAGLGEISLSSVHRIR